MALSTHDVTRLRVFVRQRYECQIVEQDSLLARERRPVANGMTADLLIIGGGPAGAVAAITVCAADLSVCIVQREDGPQALLGEAAHPGIEPLLPKLGVIHAVKSARFPRHSGTWLELGDRPRFFALFGTNEDGPWQGFQLWRPEFDAILLDAAERSGAQMLRCGRDARPLIEGNRVTGLAFADRMIHARITIDASGRQRWLARHLGLDATQFVPRRIAWFNDTTGECTPCDEASTIQSDATGWNWDRAGSAERLSMGETVAPWGAVVERLVSGKICRVVACPYRAWN